MLHSPTLRIVLSIVCLTGLLVAPHALPAGAALAASDQLPPAPALPPVLTTPPTQGRPLESEMARAHRAPLPPSGLIAGQPPTSTEDDLAPDLNDPAPHALRRPWQQPLSAGPGEGVQAASAGAAQAITVYANTHRVDGVTTPNAALDLIVTQEATTVGLSRTRTDNTGYFAIDVMNMEGSYLHMQTGMVLTVKADGATVAELAIPGPVTGAVDPATNTVTGQITGVPLPASLQIVVSNASLDVTTAPDGAFTADFNGVVDILWWDGAMVTLGDGSGNWLAWTFYPRGGIVTAPQWEEVDGCTEPGQKVSVTVTHAAASTTREATGDITTGCWWVTFPAIDPGDTVTADFGTSTVTQVVSNLGGTPDVAADSVAITGPASSPLAVYYTQYGGLSIGYLWQFGTTGASGEFTAQFPPGAINRYSWPAITHADGLHSDTYQVVPVPWVVGNWNSNGVFGYTTPSTAVTATLLRGGESVEVVTGQADPAHGRFDMTFTTPFAGGDQVHVQTAAFEDTVDLAAMALDFERDTDELALTAPPSSHFLAFIFGTDFGRPWRGWLSGGSADTTLIPLGDQLDLHNGTYGYLYRPQGGDPDDLAWTYKRGYAPRLVVNERYNDFFGNLTRPNTLFTVTAKRGAVTTGTGAGTTNAWHSAPWTYFLDLGGQEVDLQGGDSVEVSWGSEFESMEVLGLTGRADAATDRVTGTGLPNSFVRVREQNTHTGLFVPTGATGAFVADFTGLIDLRGWTQVDISAWAAGWDQTEITVPVPFARANATWDNVDGEFAPGEVVTYVVRDAGGAIKATRAGATPSWGWFSLNCDCDMVPGDTVHVTSDRGFDATLTLIPITAQVDLAADTVTGVMTGATFPGEGHVWSYSPVRDDGRGMDVPVAADGSFTADFSGEWDIRAGDEGEVWLYDANRNAVGVGWRTANMDVFYASNWVWVAGDPRAAVTVTVQGKAVMHGTIDDEGRLEGWNDSLVTWTPSRPDITPGDVVILEVGGFTKRVDPVLTIDITSIDIAADRVGGTISGPGLDQITQVFCEAYNPDAGWLQADYDAATGAYACDFGAEGWDLKRATNISVRYRDADGDMVVNEHPGQWARANVTWNSVGGVYGAGVTMQFTVTDSTGANKASGSAVGNPDGWVNDVWVDADLVPGDRVHVTTDDGFDAWLTLVDIRGRINAEANTITGTVSGAPLPAKGEVSLHSPFTDIWRGEVFDIAAGGSFAADLNPYDILVGDDAEIWYLDANGNRPGAWLATLSTETNYGGDWVVLNAAANVPFTVTVAGSTGQVKAQLTGMTDDGGAMRGWEGQWYDKWVPAHPDIETGDRVTFEAGGYTKIVQPVAEIRAVADVTSDLITGRIFAPGITQPVPVWCSVWVDNGPPSVNAQPRRVDPDGGAFTCDFGAVGWDLQKGQYAAVGFLNPNNDTIYNSFGVEGLKLYLPVVLR